MTAVLTPEIEATHADRPTSHVASPFRLLPGRPDRVEWTQRMLDPPLHVGAKPNERYIKMVQEISHSPYGNQIGAKIIELNELYFAVCGRVDGLLASVDSLTVENLKLSRQLEESANRYDGMKSQLMAEVKDRDVQIAALQRWREKGPESKRKQVHTEG